MSRFAYRAQLRALREELLAMSDLVCEALQRALNALEERDEGLAQRGSMATTRSTNTISRSKVAVPN